MRFKTSEITGKNVSGIPLIKSGLRKGARAWIGRLSAFSKSVFFKIEWDKHLTHAYLS